VAIFRNLVFWFMGLLVILVAGFWKTYFSVIFDGPHPAHHLHGMVMTLWVLLLISQAWLVRTRSMNAHRTLGRASYLLAPLVVITGIIVTFHNIAGAPDPMVPFMLSLYWFGWFSAILFGILYGLAMVHRGDFQLHARYMMATGLVFLFPGLSRVIFNAVQQFGLPGPSFYQLQFTIGALGLALIAWDRAHGRFRAPFIVFTALWGLHLLVWQLIPGWAWWRSFTAWSAAVWQA
jgi:uncharacterized membrane protein YozB (DUF420 family)